MRHSRWDIGWIWSLGRANLRAAATSPWNFSALAAFMAANNLIWFALWWLFFGLAQQIRGWTVTDVAALYGIVAVAYGVYITFFGGARLISYKVAQGDLDIYLGRPRSTLLALLFSNSDPTGVGDIVSGVGLILWVMAGDPARGALALGFGVLGASVIVSTYVAINCLVFWAGGRSSALDHLCDCFLVLATMPQIGLPMAVKIMVYTVLPAAFVGFLPVEILRDFSAAKLAAVIAAAIICPLVTAWIFRAGLKRYASGNRMIEHR